MEGNTRDNITREDAAKASLRISNAVDILQALQTTSFMSRVETLVGSPGSCFDWVVENYNLIASILNELSYTLSEQIGVIDEYIYNADQTQNTQG